MRYGTIKKEMAEAKRCGLVRFFTEIPCKQCNGEVRYTVNGCCISCLGERNFKMVIRG